MRRYSIILSRWMRLSRLILLLIFLSASLLHFGIPSFASAIFGTKGFNYSFPLSKQWTTKIFSLQDVRGNLIENGFSLSTNFFSFKTAKIYKDNLLSNSIFSKMTWRSDYSLWGNRLESKYITGYMQLPSLYSSWTSFQPSETDGIVVHVSQTLSRTNPSFDWNLGLKINYVNKPSEIPIPNSLADVDIFSLTYLQTQGEITFKRQIGNNTALVSYGGLVRTSSYFPLDFFSNQEIGIGIFNQNFSAKYFYPTVFQLVREKYPYQDKRVELNFSLPFLFATEFEGEAVFRAEEQLYSFMLTKNIENINAGLFVSRDFNDSRIGVQLATGMNLLDSLGESYVRHESIPRYPDTGDYMPREPEFPATVTAATNFEQLSTNLKTPEEIAWYTAKFIDYTYDHVNISGMWTMYSPEEVFDLKKGNCTEKARFQANILNKHGYETQLISYIERKAPHTVVAYKDPSTQKWNILENIGPYLYNSQADSPLLAFTQTDVGWLSVTFKDLSGKGFQQIDSTTKWYVQDWFEKD